MNNLSLFLKTLCLIVLTASGLFGCSSATAPTRYYLLSDPAQAGESDSACGLRLSNVTVAPYLQRSHIMIQSGTNELVPAMQHRWSEPLEAGVYRLLARCLGGNGGTTRGASVQIDHLHGNTEGKVVLQARWSFNADALGNMQDTQNTQNTRRKPLVPITRQFSSNLPQPVAGYDALVSTQRALVLELCADIRAALPSC